MKKQLLFLLLFVLCLPVLTGCSDDDEPLSPVAHTEWAAKINPWEASVPEKYRENGYWILRFSDDEMSLAIQCDGLIVDYEFKMKYRMEGENEIVGLSNDGGVYDLYMQDKGTALYFPYYGTKLFKQ